MHGYVVYVIGCPIIVYLLVLIVLKVKALNQRIRQYFEEEASGPKDPYADMIALAQVEDALQKQKKLQQQSKALIRGGQQPPEA